MWSNNNVEGQKFKMQNNKRNPKILNCERIPNFRLEIQMEYLTFDPQLEKKLSKIDKITKFAYLR